MHPKGKNTPVDRVLVGWPIWPAYVCFFWKSITFLERYIAKFFFAHKLFIYWSLHKKIPSPWIIFWGGVGSRKVFFPKKFVVFWKLLIFGATYNLQTPMEWPRPIFFPWKFTFFSIWNCFQLLWIISMSNFNPHGYRQNGPNWPAFRPFGGMAISPSLKMMGESWI